MDPFPFQQEYQSQCFRVFRFVSFRFYSASDCWILAEPDWCDGCVCVLAFMQVYVSNMTKSIRMKWMLSNGVDKRDKNETKNITHLYLSQQPQ